MHLDSRRRIIIASFCGILAFHGAKWTVSPKFVFVLELISLAFQAAEKNRQGLLITLQGAQTHFTRIRIIKRAARMRQ
jgi:hypothetical protein